MNRLNQIKSEISKLYNIDQNSIEAINKWGELYSCRGGDKDFVLRVSNYKSYEEQEAETKWVNFLHHNGISVSNPIKSINQNYLEEVEIDGEIFIAIIFHKADGKIASSDEWNGELFESCGELIAKLHNLSEHSNINGSRYRIKPWYDQEEYKYENYIPNNQIKLRKRCGDIIDSIKQLPKSDDSYGIIHSDITQGNFFVDKGRITLFDFQDCEGHYFINDLAIAIYFGVYGSFNGDDLESYTYNFVKALFKGYQKYRKLDKFWVEKIPLFLKLRELLSLNIFYCYDDIEKLEDDMKVLLNSYRKNLEYDIPVIDIDFAELLKDLNNE